MSGRNEFTSPLGCRVSVVPNLFVPDLPDYHLVLRMPEGDGRVAEVMLSTQNLRDLEDIMATAREQRERYERGE